MLDDGTFVEKALTNLLLTSNNRIKDKVKKNVHQLPDAKKMHKERCHYEEKIESLRQLFLSQCSLLWKLPWSCNVKKCTKLNVIRVT